MKILKTVIFSILRFGGTIVLTVVTALATLIGYFALEMFVVGRGDYLLFVGNGANMVPVVMIMILIIYAFTRLKEKLLNRKEKEIALVTMDEEPVDIESLGWMERFVFKFLSRLITHDQTILRIIRIIKICYIPALVIAIYCGFTSYAILYSDTVKVSSPIAPSGVIYKYSDIKAVNVGVKKENRNSYTTYYKLVFKDNKSVDLFGGSLNEDKGVGFENVLLDLDKKLIAQGTAKSVDKKYFSEYSNGLDKDFVSRVEKLFDEK